MLSPDYLDHAPDTLITLIQQLEDDILQDVGRRIGKMGEVTDTAQWQLWRLDQLQGLQEDVIRKLSQYSGKTAEEIRTLLQDAGTKALSTDDEIYRAVGLNPEPFQESTQLTNLLNAGYRQTMGTWKNLTATTANTVTGQFERALDVTWSQIASGAFDYKTAIKRAVDNLALHMDGVTYPSGHRDTLEVAVRRAALTGINQTAAQLQLQRMEDVGCEFVEVTAHPGARPEHAIWQGKVYHTGGAVWYEGVYYEDFETATGYGTGPGLCGWNCRHNFFPFFPGLSERAYPDEKLREYENDTVEFNGKTYTRYEASQMQRALERKVRKYKQQYLAEDAAGLDSAQSAVKLKTAREQLKQFTYETGLDLDSARTGVSGFGRSAASKASWTVRKKAQEVLAEQERRVKLQAEVRAQIRTGQIPSGLNQGNQNKHIPDSPGYLPGRSFIYGNLETAQALIDRYKSTGELKLTRSGNWTHKEFITADTPVGVSVNPETGSASPTRRFAIHYGKRGTHIVPMEETKK